LERRGRRVLLVGAALALLAAVAVVLVVTTRDGDETAPARRDTEPDAETLRAATLAGPSGPMSEALRSDLTSLRCDVAYRADIETESRTVEIGLDYGGAGDMLHFDDAVIQIIYQDLEAYPPGLFIEAATKPGGVALPGQPVRSPRIDVDRLSPGDVVREANLSHPSSGSTLRYSCAVE
jgi:hypothetical protein